MAMLREEQTEEEKQFIKKKSNEKKEKKKKGRRAELSDDDCPFEEVPSQSPEKPSPKKRSPKKPKNTIKSSPKSKASPKKEPSSPVKSPTRRVDTGPKKEGDYDPTKSKYDAIADACWTRGEPVPYHALAATLAACEENSGRLAKTEYLANFFRSVIELRHRIGNV